MPKDIPYGNAAFRARNNHLFPNEPISSPEGAGEAIKQRMATAPIRLRQSSKPLMNKLETEFLEKLKFDYRAFGGMKFIPQSITFKLANGLRYTPDFFSITEKISWEVKGAWVDGDSFPKLKMAASVYPEISWRLVWKKESKWCEQIILP